ncbi:MAG: hypothetical protein ACE5JK_03565, partial [Candidatus Omnitrophota bacterium]
SPHTGEGVIEISVRNTENIKEDETFGKNDFIVGLKEDRKKPGVPIPNYMAASVIGLSLATLREAVGEVPDKDLVQAFDAMDSEIKEEICERIESIFERYGVRTDDNPFNIHNLKFMVVGCSKNKRDCAIDYALPPIAKMAIEKINEYHRIIHRILQAA